MLQKLLRLFDGALIVATPIIIWFANNFVRYTLKIPASTVNHPSDMISHIWAVQFATSILCGLLSKSQTPMKLGLWGRSFILALMGGLIGGQLLIGLRPLPTSLSERLLISLLLAIFGLVQISLIGQMAGVFLRDLRKNIAR